MVKTVSSETGGLWHLRKCNYCMTIEEMCDSWVYRFLYEHSWRWSIMCMIVTAINSAQTCSCDEVQCLKPTSAGCCDLLQRLYHRELPAGNVDAVRSATATGIVIAEAFAKITVNEAPLRPTAGNHTQPETVHRFLRLLCIVHKIVVIGANIVGKAVRGRGITIRRGGGRRLAGERINAGAVGEAQLPAHHVRHEVVHCLILRPPVRADATPLAKVKDFNEAGVYGVAQSAKAAPQPHCALRGTLLPVTPWKLLLVGSITTGMMVNAAAVEKMVPCAACSCY